MRAARTEIKKKQQQQSKQQLAAAKEQLAAAKRPRRIASAGSHEKRRSRPEFFKQGLSHSYMTGSAQLECLVHAQPTVMTLPDVKSQQTRSSAVELQPQSHVAPIMPLNALDCSV